MAEITFRGEKIHTVGTLPNLHHPAPSFLLTKNDLTDLSLDDLKNKRVVLNIFPSVDTPVCAKSVVAFNKAAAHLENTEVLCVSADLPFAQTRFCAAEKIGHVQTVSTFRHPVFGLDYGVLIEDGALKNLLSRAIVIIDQRGNVIYTEQVPEIGSEPNYQAAFKALS